MTDFCLLKGLVTTARIAALCCALCVTEMGKFSCVMIRVVCAVSSVLVQALTRMNWVLGGTIWDGVWDGVWVRIRFACVAPGLGVVVLRWVPICVGPVVLG